MPGVNRTLDVRRSRPGPLPRRQFASDNYSGICPEAWEAMAAANVGHACSYGDDDWTARACDLLREFFECDCDVFFTFTGTAANSLSVATFCKPYQSVICHDYSHLETDECGAPEFFANGSKVLLVGGEYGKIDLAAVQHTVHRRTDIHYPKPALLSVTQATELGTVYTAEDLRAIGASAQHLCLRVHMDGARLANALATLKCSPKELTWKAGVDVVCLGGSKNAMAFGEAVVFFNREMAREFDFRCKQAGQLASKMRFIAAQWCGMLETGAWLRRAEQANRCAALMARELAAIPGVTLMFPAQANSVFVQMPSQMIERLHALDWHFYTFIGCGGARLMCSWDCTEEDVLAFVADARKVAGVAVAAAT